MTKNVELALPANSEMSEYRVTVSAVQNAANELKIDSPQQMEVAEELLRNITAGEKLIVSRKEEITRPLMKALASGRALFKPFETDFASAKGVVKTKMLAWNTEQEAEADKERYRLLARVEKGTMKPETAASKLEVIGSGPKANIRVIRKLSITDETLIPREYLVVDREAVTRALFAGTAVPGAELVEEKIIATI